MEMVTITNTVPKDAAAFAKALVDLIDAVQKQLADGFQASSDLPVIAIEAFKDFPAIIQGLSSLKADFEYDKGKMFLALMNELDRVI